MRTLWKASVLQFQPKAKQDQPTAVSSQNFQWELATILSDRVVCLDKLRAYKIRIGNSCSLQAESIRSNCRKSSEKIIRIKGLVRFSANRSVISSIRSKASYVTCYASQRSIDGTRQAKSASRKSGSGMDSSLRRCSQRVRRQLCTRSLGRLLKRTFSPT